MASSPSRDPGSDPPLYRQQLLADLGDRALTAGDLDGLSAEAVETVVEAVGADRAVLVERSPDAAVGFVRAAVDYPTDVEPLSLSTDSVLGRALTATEPIVAAVSGDSSPAARLLDGDSGSVMAVAVGDPDDPWGVLAAVADETDPFAAVDGPFLANVATLLATAIEREGAYNEAEEIYGRISDAFFAVDEEWRFTYLNDRARDLIAPEGRRLVGENLWEAFPAAVGRRFEEEYERAMAEQEAVTFEEYYPDPIDAWFEVRAYPSESGLSVYFHDVTERKEARQRLAEERDMFAEGPAVVFRWKNEDGWPVEYVSDNVEDVLGYAPAELESGEVPYTDLLHDEEIDRIAREVADHSDDDTERFSHEPYRVRTKAGDVRWVQDTTKILRNADGEITHYLGYLVDVTERKEREAELRRYEAMVEAVEDGVYVVDESGRFTTVNEAYTSMTGYDRSELLGAHVSKVVDEAVLARAQQTEAAMREDAVEGVTLEAEIETASGERVPAEASFAMVETPEGDAERRVGVVRDVTDRERRERELERYETLFTESTDVNAVLEPDGTFQYLPPSVEHVLGYERAELAGENAFDYVHPEDREQVAGAFERMVEDPAYRPTNEFRFRHADGSWVWLESTGRNLLDDPAIAGLVAYTREITERKERERELAERERQLSTLIDNVPGMVYRCDNTHDWPMEFVSDGCRAVTGYDPEALEDGDVTFGTDVVHEDDRARVWTTVQEGLEENGTFLATYRVVTPDGTVRWVRERGRGIYNDDGDLESIEGVVIDVTERKRLEAELEEVFGRVTDAFYALDADFRFTHVNERAETLLGHDEEELVGEWLFDVFPEVEETGHVAEAFRTAMETQESQSYEAYSEDRDFWVDATIYPSETGVSVYFEDATDRIERERELERTERRFEAIFEDPNILVGLLEPDGTVVDINETAMEYIDADLSAVTGEPFWETPWWGEGEDVTHDVMEWTERAANGEYVDFEADLTRPNGERYVINGVFRPVTDDDGEVVSVIVSDRDVTERREYERKLAESERRYRTIADYFPNGIVTLFDHDQRYTLAAGQGFADIPVDPADLEGEHFGSVWDPETAEALEPVFEAALDGEERSVELEYVGREWIVHAVPITDGRGEVFAGMTMARDITERKQRERELAKYETIVETINDGIYVKDADGYFTMVNEAYAELTGYDREELVGSHASLVVDEETMADSTALRDAAADGVEDGPTMEADIERADGTTVPTEGTFATIETDGEPESIGVVRDISERLEQRRRIEESERRYRTLVENFPDGAVGLFDQDLEYTAVGGEFLDQVGVSKEERLGDSVYDIYPDEIVTDVEPHFHAALDGEKRSFEVEYHGRHLLAHTLPVRNGDGDVFAGMLVVQDVTERREAERELRESEARFRMIAENVDEIVWMATPDAEEFIYVNPAFEDVWGIDREHLYDDATTFLEYVHPADREHVREQFEALPDERFDAEYRIVRPDGQVRWVHSTGARIQDEDAGMVRLVGTGEDVTERVERERRLEESERRYRTLAEHFPNGAVGVYDDELRYTLAEGAMLGHTLPSAEELEGGRMPDLFPESTAADLEPVFRGAIEDGATTDVTTTFNDRHWRVWATPLRDADGEIFAGLSFAQDITEQVERERELERALDLLEKTERIADVGSWELDVASDDVYWSDHLFDILGYEGEAEPSLDDALSLYHDEDRPTVEAAIQDTIETGEPFDVEVRLVRATTGELRWLRLQGAAEIEAGEVVTVRGAAQDVTERKERERTLARRAEQQRAAADVGQFALETDDLDELMAEASRMVADVLDNDYCKVLDLDDASDELLLRQGVGWQDALVGTATVSADEADSQAAYTLANDHPIVVEDLATEDRFTGPDLLREHDVTSGISTVIGPFDEPWGILGTHDTDRREYTDEDVIFVQTVANVLAEAIERKQYEADLERLVAELEESNERLEQFAYAASHDLQEPLRMVSSYLQLIEQRYAEALDEEAEEFLEFAVDGADRMRDMIDGLLKYSRVDTRGDPLEPVDLDGVLADVRDDLQVRIEESGADIEAEALPTVEGDAGQLRQVFQNLLSNAIEYSGEEPPRVEVSASREGEMWAISVSDEGIGIAPEETDQIFDVFQSLHGPEESGTGIGLALCERIVERHDGDIRVDSEPGSGSTFTFTLPPADGDDA